LNLEKGSLGTELELGSKIKKETGIRPPDCKRKCNASNYVNGILMSEVHDEDPKKIDEGQVYLASRFNVGPPMKVEGFRGFDVEANVSKDWFFEN